MPNECQSLENQTPNHEYTKRRKHEKMKDRNVRGKKRIQKSGYKRQESHRKVLQGSTHSTALMTDHPSTSLRAFG
jgi:hypothetical protein